MRRLDEGGEASLVKLEEPVNKYPDFVALLVRHLERLSPALGKERIANMLARAGLHLRARGGTHGALGSGGVRAGKAHWRRVFAWILGARAT